MYRWLISSLIAFLLADWGYLSVDTQQIPDWGVADTLILESCLVEVIIAFLLAEVEQKRTVLQKQGFDLKLPGARSESRRAMYFSLS